MCAPEENRPQGAYLTSVRRVFFNSRGLRAGWRLLIFIGIFICLRFLGELDRFKDPPSPGAAVPGPCRHHIRRRLTQALVATWIMARFERRHFLDYGIPVRNAFGRDFRGGLAWGLASTALLVGLIATLVGYRILGLAIHSGALWYFFSL